MARRSSYNSIMNQIARDAARRERERQQLIERQRREAVRLAAQQEKEAKQRYLEARLEETDQMNVELAERLQDLQTILEHTLEVDDTISFDSLRIHETFREFKIPDHLATAPKEPRRDDYLSKVTKPGCLASLVPGTKKRHERELEQAENNYKAALKQYETAVAEREAKIRALQAAYEEEKKAFDQKVQQRDQEVSELESAYLAGDPEAITTYCTMVLERSDYPVGFPQEFRLAYVPESKGLVIEYELPTVDIVPSVAEYRYVKTRDSIDEKPRKATEVKELYRDIVASICLRTIHEMFEADQAGHLDTVTFNGFVQAIDPATGHDIRPHLISVRATKERFANIELSRVDKRACLRNLGAQVSPRPDEIQAVKPVVEFEMVDKRFVERSDVLSDLETRPNLMDLDPFEFENLVSELFDQIGFQTKQTRSSRDGGVDAVAFDTRPILGGKVVIQAKRYRNTVGVSAVRDLYGTMINEGANKGVLVTTSSYGSDAYDFAKDKPIELIDGGGLLYLLEQAGIRAQIIMPDD